MREGSCAELTPRLKLAARMCGEGCRLVDVGCDHAFLAAYAVVAGARGAVACDVRTGPLEKARKTVESRGLQDKIEIRQCDGLQDISPHDGDTIAICGMGGELIARILRDAPWTRAGEHRLVLQPQSRDRELRRFLGENGYIIENEALAMEGRRLYCVMSARGGSPEKDEYMHVFSPWLKSDPLFDEFLTRKIEKYRRIIDGRRLGGGSSHEAEQIFKMLLEQRAAQKNAEGMNS